MSFNLSDAEQAKIVFKTYTNDLLRRNQLVVNRSQKLIEIIRLQAEVESLDSRINNLENQISELEPVARKLVALGYV